MGRKTNVLELDLTPVHAKRILEDVAQESGRVYFTNHAEERMIERNITRHQVLRCLKHGNIIEGPCRNINGNWQLSIHVFSAGENITVVAALNKDKSGNYIIVITAYN